MKGFLWTVAVLVVWAGLGCGPGGAEVAPSLLVGTWKEEGFDNRVTYQPTGTFQSRITDPKGTVVVEGVYHVDGASIHLGVAKMVDSGMTPAEQADLDGMVKRGEMDRDLHILRSEKDVLQVEVGGKKTFYKRVP